MCLLVVATTLVTSAQPAVEEVRVLVVDETKTFTSTMRVAGLVGALRSVGMFEVGVALADVTTDYDDPLLGRMPAEDEEPYDMIVILPRGLDDGTIDQIWVVSAGVHSLSPIAAAGLGMLSTVVDQVFGEIAEAIDVTEDLWPGLLWAVYETKGWIR
jgi:hypothetical protein